jgi:phosphate transport system substrate-binding protein
MKNLFVFLLFFSTVFCYGQNRGDLVIPEVIASSYLTDAKDSYPPRNLVDHTWESWAEGVNGNGVGEYFILKLWKRVPVAGFVIKNGYGNIDLFAKNNRVKAFKIYADWNNYIETIVIDDTFSFKQYYFKEPVDCMNIRFEIADVYPGTMYDDTCVAEIALLDHTGWEQDYANRLLWFFGYQDAYKNYDEFVASVGDPERDMLLDYLPFALSGDFKIYKYDEKKDDYIEIKNKVARLSRTSSLRLTNNLPRIDGATAMYPLYSSFVRAVYPEKQPVNSSRGYFSAFLNWDYYPNVDLLNKNYADEYRYAQADELKSIVQCNTTSKAYDRLIDGKTDIIFCYEPSEAQIKAAAAKGKRFNLTPICKDAFVFIVNARNTANNITQSQIRDIYSGRVTNWKPISGVEEPIIAYQRAENSGSQTILQSIMKGDKIMPAINETEFVSRGMYRELILVASNFYNYNCAIGYTFLFYMNQMAGNIGVKALSVDGIAPNKENIQSNKYPFVQTVYAVTTGNESENTKKFIEWILSPQGQELAEKTGYIPIR